MKSPTSLEKFSSAALDTTKKQLELIFQTDLSAHDAKLPAATQTTVKPGAVSDRHIDVSSVVDPTLAALAKNATILSL